jgi:hypothetical protein
MKTYFTKLTLTDWKDNSIKMEFKGFVFNITWFSPLCLYHITVLKSPIGDDSIQDMKITLLVLMRNLIDD